MGISTFGLTRNKACRPPLNLNGVSLYPCDTFCLTELESVLRSVRPDAIVHLAAAGVTAGGNDFDQLMHCNIEYTLNLIRAAANTGCPAIIHTGSCFEYSPVNDRKLTEQDLVSPFSLYGSTKAASVQLAIGLARHLGMPLTVLRLFGVYGKGESDKRLLPTLMRGLQTYQPIELTDGTQIRDWMYIDDAATGFCDAIAQFERLEKFTVYNLCTGEGHSVREVGETLADAMRRPKSLLRWGVKESRKGEPAMIVGDPKRFQDATAWHPNFDLSLGIEASLKHSRSDTFAAA